MFLLELKKELRDKKTYIYGSGTQGVELNSYLEKWEGICVEAFIDNNAEKQKALVAGKRCISLEMALEEGATECNILVSPRNNDEIIKSLGNMNVSAVYDGKPILDYYRKNYYFIPKKYEDGDWRGVRPFNYYDSPYFDLKEIHEKETEIFDENREVLDIDCNLEQQLTYLRKMSEMELIGKMKRLINIDIITIMDGLE